MIRSRATWWWGHVAVLVVLMAACYVCIGPAVSGHQRWSPGGAIGALVGGIAGSRYHDAAYWRLPAVDRRRVAGARRAGAPSWDPHLDLITLDQLERAARHARSRWVTASVVGVVVAAIPVVAAVRTGSAWYLLCLLPMAVPVSAVVREALGEDPRVRLARFRDAVDEDPPAEISPGAGSAR